MLVPYCKAHTSIITDSTELRLETIRHDGAGGAESQASADNSTIHSFMKSIEDEDESGTNGLSEAKHQQRVWTQLIKSASEDSS